jgi:hypothetical protein
MELQRKSGGFNLDPPLLAKGKQAMREPLFLPDSDSDEEIDELGKHRSYSTGRENKFSMNAQFSQNQQPLLPPSRRRTSV